MINLNDAIELLRNGIAQFKDNDDNCMTEGELVILLEELQRYKKLEKAGRLVELPCRVGGWVESKNKNWLGTVEEFIYDSDGLFLFVKSANGIYATAEEVVCKE